MLDIREASYSRRLDLSGLSAVGISCFLHGDDTDEERAASTISEIGASGSARMYPIRLIDDALCEIGGYGPVVNLFEVDELHAFANSLEGVVAVDLTSLEHRIWAPIVKTFVELNREFIALYAEPDDYRRSEDLPGAIYDLSTARGIEPLPGFARLARRSDDEGYFAPLLGFEGARLSHIFDQEEVEISRTSPVIGSPGFRIEYPAYAYLANRDTLSLDRMDQRVEFARAGCPFEAYRAIERIHSRTGGAYLRVAPIGTKPHALGAILYAIRHKELIELIYDNPVRSTGRTRGARGVYVYEVSDFLASLDADRIAT